MASKRLHGLLPALALLVAACAAPAPTGPTTPATGSPGASASPALAAGSPTAAARTGASYASSPAPSPTARPTPRPTPAPATRPPATRPAATHPPATRPPATPAPSAVAAKIVDFGFTPATLTVTVGATVTWTNTGKVDHTVTANGGAFDSGTLSPGASFSFTFKVAGAFAYHCAIHPFMTGTVIVKG